MKRIDLVNSLHFIELDIRPSLIDKLAHELNKEDRHGDSYESICKMSEEELLKVPHITKDIVDRIKEHLAGYGLRLGMTDKDIEDYKDAEYNKLHGKEKVEDTYEKKQGSASIKEETLKGNSKQTEDKNSNNQIEYRNKINANPFEKGTLNDLEWMRHQTRIQLLTHQSWFVRLFFPFSFRLQIAMVQSSEVFKVFTDDIVQRASECRSQESPKQTSK